jgi:hypothetical protein
MRSEAYSVGKSGGEPRGGEVCTGAMTIEHDRWDAAGRATLVMKQSGAHRTTLSTVACVEGSPPCPQKQDTARVPTPQS